MALRVLLVSEDDGAAMVGAVTAARRLGQALRALGHECDIFYNGDAHPWPRTDRWRFLVSPWLAWRGVRRAWRDSGPYDVIDAPGAEGWWICLARRWGQFPGAVVIARSHGLEHLYHRELVNDHRAGIAYRPWWRRWWYPATRMPQVALAYRGADQAIVLSQRGFEEVIRRGWKPASRIAIIPHGVALERWAAAPPPDAPRGGGALFSGTWYSGKGITYLAEAHSLLLERGIHLPLTLLAAAGPLAGSEAFIRNFFTPASQPWLTVRPRVTDAEQVYAYYRSHDFLVLPSTFDGFGLVVTEALGQRLPVVCSTGAGVSDHLKDGETALVVPARNAAALAAAMQRLWTDLALRRRIGAAGHAWVGGLTWEGAAVATVAVYQAARARQH